MQRKATTTEAGPAKKVIPSGVCGARNLLFAAAFVKSASILLG